MNRQSTLSSRTSHLGGSGAQPRGAPASSAIHARILEKRQEWEAVSALDETTRDIRLLLEEVAAQSDIMADGAQTIAAVMANWPNVLRIISLFTKDANGAVTVENDPNGTDDTTEALPRLVRIGVEGLAPGNT